LKIGITIGDPAGIGPEIIEAALASNEIDDAHTYRVIGSASGHNPGHPTAASALAAINALSDSVALLKSHEIDAVVTAPISKSRAREQGFEFPGQTEFFASAFGVTDYSMILTGGAITVGLVTIHLPLEDAVRTLRTWEIVRVGKHLANFVRRRTGRAPRIAVAGLNPHAGEDGLLGSEERKIIEPAVDELNALHGDDATFSGPHAPDTVFLKCLREGVDAVLCMYHDQGLIPLKLHAFDSGVNVTWGLPIIRTSPDHGTAFDIAGTNTASPGSMIAAIQLATGLASR
jgi:4-hydroxythreonine-4-phosphate dehydrogenase